MFNHWMEIYWQSLGLKMSVLQGMWVDSLSFSLVEIWVDALLGLLVMSFVPGLLKYPWRFRLVLIFLFTLWAGGQGVWSPFYPVPSAHREKVSHRLPHDSVKPTVLNHWVQNMEADLMRAQFAKAYEFKNDAEILRDANLNLDQVIEQWHYAPGRQVAGVKSMQGLTQVLGRIYGGPAYHDPWTAEIALDNSADYPLPKYWRIHAIFHEVAHAKGFTREMDAEILCFLALMKSRDSVYRGVAELAFLAKLPLDTIILPHFWEKERLVQRAVRKQYLQDHLVFGWIKTQMENWGLVNSGTKYGSVLSLDSIPVDHPFFAPILWSLNHGRL